MSATRLLRTLRGTLVVTVLSTGACVDSRQTSDDAAFPHPREMDLPDPGFQPPSPENHRVQLDNGFTAYVVEDRTAPLVTLAAVIPAGRAHDVRAGAAEALVHSLRTRGPGTMTGGDFRATLRRMVARYEVTQTAEETRLLIEVPETDWQEALVLLADLLRRPSISAAEIAAWAGTAQLAGRARGGAAEYEGSLASAVSLFSDHVFRGHPFGDAPEPAEARALTPPAVRAFHRRHFGPEAVTLAIGGSLDAEAATTALRSAFADWTASGPGPADAPVFPEIAPDGAATVWVYDKDALQGWVVIGHALPIVPLEDQAPLEVMNYILGGGHVDTRLFRETRDKRGLTNDDSGFLDPGIHGPGMYTFRTYGRPETVRLLIHLTLSEIRRMTQEPVSDEDLFVARGALADGTFTLAYRSGADAAISLATEWSRYGDHTRSASYRDRIRAVTREDVARVARAYLQPDRMDIVILGPVEAINEAPALEGERPLSAYGTIIEGR